ncbi:10 TM acyl transferase domain found in Cas1p-domain-containing protein [Morchella snyderi]|nr:10 TM acyl transferase domain found in Cas1p-domain-containing protein [Morchella snyderi]
MVRFFSRSYFTPTIVDRISAAFICITLLGVALRYCWFDARDPFKCGAILNEGEWLDYPPENSTIVPENWQPPGCMMHKYISDDVSTCLANRRVLFIGDASIRQVFWSVVKALDPKANPATAEKHVDITVEKSDVKLEFVWDPWLNSSRLHTELSSYNDGKVQDVSGNPPALFLMGSGLWYARHENMNGLKMWKDSIDDVVQHMRKGRRTTDMTESDLLLIAPVIVPAWNKLNDDRKATITPQEIRAMNQYLQQLSDFQGVDVIWSWHEMINDLPQVYESSGIHLVDSIAEKQAEALLNLRCNAVTATKYPYDQTCCNRYRAPNHVQWIGLLFILGLLPAVLYMRSKDEKTGIKSIAQAAWLPSGEVAWALLVFGLAVVYCFYADRTQVFNKAHKQYFTSDFLWGIVLSLAAGLFTLRKNSETHPDQPFLNRLQIDEWKGWMQFAILVYHYTGASKITVIYGFIRVTIAAYLFMTGYEHTLYFLSQKDYSLKRAASVLVRLNLLSCVLPFMMGTNYLFYYFAPLCSYWFLVVFTTMRVGEQYNSNTKFLATKIVLAAILSAALAHFPGVLEAIFRLVGFLARTEWDVNEWRFRVSLDMWIVFVGMAVAIAVNRNKENSYTSMQGWVSAKKYATIASIISIVLYLLFEATREDKYEYNTYHPYISVIPILSFITLRNSTPQLRNTHSRVFSWLGKCSLETFTLQYHIWMAADTKGLLGLGAFGLTGRTSNFVLATILFLYVSHRVAGATVTLSRWVLGIPPRSNMSQQQPGLPTPRGVDLDNDSDEPEEMNDEAAGSSRRRSGEGLKSRPRAKTLSEETPSGYWGNLKYRMTAILVIIWFLSLTY